MDPSNFFSNLNREDSVRTHPYFTDVPQPNNNRKIGMVDAKVNLLPASELWVSCVVSGLRDKVTAASYVLAATVTRT
jgi:hypothetical protein